MNRCYGVNINNRKARAIRLGESLAVVLPKDWTRGNGIRPGDELEVCYDGKVSIYASKITGRG